MYNINDSGKTKFPKDVQVTGLMRLSYDYRFSKHFLWGIALDFWACDIPGHMPLFSTYFTFGTF